MDRLVKAFSAVDQLACHTAYVVDRTFVILHMQIRGNQIAVEVFQQRLLEHPEAEARHAVSHIKEHASRPCIQGLLNDASLVCEDTALLPMPGVCDNISLSYQLQNLCQRRGIIPYMNHQRENQCEKNHLQQGRRK